MFKLFIVLIGLDTPCFFSSAGPFFSRAEAISEMLMMSEREGG